MKNYRLYSFVAGGYLSELQKGLQTAHVVSEMYMTHGNTAAYQDWAKNGKTIIILNAFNHGGVVGCYEQLREHAEFLSLPNAIFYEDEVSMNNMATACGILLPEELYDVERGETFEGTYYWHGEKVYQGTVEFDLIELVKGFRLA